MIFVSMFIFISRLERYYFFFFFQAEDGIRDYKVTGVQTCAIPISENSAKAAAITVASPVGPAAPAAEPDRKSTRLNSSHLVISYAVFCLKKKKKKILVTITKKKKKKKNKK